MKKTFTRKEILRDIYEIARSLSEVAASNTRIAARSTNPAVVNRSLGKSSAYLVASDTLLQYLKNAGYAE